MSYNRSLSGGGGVGGVDYNNNQYDDQYHHHDPQHNTNNYYESSSSSAMTIDEMRSLHHTALSQAESKRTELRLVLASRYRELVGSSDEVQHMHERADELHELVVALPTLVECVKDAADGVTDCGSVVTNGRGQVVEEGSTTSRKLFMNGTADCQQTVSEDKSSTITITTTTTVDRVRDQLSKLPRTIHCCLDANNVHGAAASLIELFDIISSSRRSNDSGGDPYPLATALSSSSSSSSSCNNKEEEEGKNTRIIIPTNPLLNVQMKMIYLHVQTLPSKTVKLARKILLKSAFSSSSSKKGGGGGGAQITAAALSALDLLDVTRWQQSQNQQQLTPSRRGSDASSSTTTRATKLLDLYYDSKATLLNKLLNKLTLPPTGTTSSTTTTGGPSLDATSVTNRAEIILSKIVLILQYDVILYPYQIFVLRKFFGGTTTTNNNNNNDCERIMSTLPIFDADVLKSKASNFLAAHLPLIRTKVKSVLMIIAGTTASKLGQIRQTLYDKTDGIDCRNMLDTSSGGVCTWDDAVGNMVDVRVVSHGTTCSSSSSSAAIGSKDDGGEQGGGGGTGSGSSSMNGGGTSTATSKTTTTATTLAARRFSLWGALFSNTFSSLVHSLLTTSFHSVHVRVVSTLRTSLARAPPFNYMLPHEAHRNALRIACDLDVSLRKVSDDAHELLVHAEEREESERRLRQSLYVQTCEIMGRLLNELRRMLVVAGGGDREEEDATKVFIVGRLCHLLKFRLKSLPTLLDPKSSPAVMLASGLGANVVGVSGKSHSGMITLMELSSSFDLADDDDDGLISFDEAMEAMESAFSGTHFHGAEMVRDTLLLTASHHSSPHSGSGGVVGDGSTSGGVVSNGSGTYASSSNMHTKSTPQNVTLSELALLSARGLRHAPSGHESALGTVQSSLDDIVNRCFKDWARAALSPPLNSFTTTLRESMGVASTVSDMEWRRLHGLIEKEDDALLKEVGESKGDTDRVLNDNSSNSVGEVSPHVVSYLLAVAGVLNRSVCPADSLPPVPSLEYAEALGISCTETEIPNMMVTIRGSLLGEALSSMSHSLKQEILSTPDDEDGVADDEILKKCAPSSLIQLSMDVKFIHKCFFERNQHGFLLSSDAVNDSRVTMDSLLERLIASVSNTLRDGSPINSAISERHAQVFTSCDLFLSSLFGEDPDDKFSSSNGAATTTNGVSSSQSFMLNPLPSSRRFVLLPIQAEKSLTELQLRGKYGKKSQEDKTSSKDGTSSGNALGSGFGFLSSMLTKTR